MEFVVKIAAMPLEIENETCPDLGCCSFCSKIFHSNVSSESPDNSKRSEEFSLKVCFQPPIITTPFSVGEEIIVDERSTNGSLGPRKFQNIYITFMDILKIQFYFLPIFHP